MVLSLQTCWNISSFKYTGRNDTKFSEGINMVNNDKNSRISHFIIWIRARNNSAIPIMPVLDPDLASETKPISQYENFNYGGWVQFKSFFAYFLFILARVDKVQRKIQCYREDLWLIWAGMGLQITINGFHKLWIITENVDSTIPFFESIKDQWRYRWRQIAIALLVPPLPNVSANDQILICLLMPNHFLMRTPWTTTSIQILDSQS